MLKKLEIPSFAEILGYDLDGLGITICNVAGTNFNPYIKLAEGLGMHLLL